MEYEKLGVINDQNVDAIHTPLNRIRESVMIKFSIRIIETLCLCITEIYEHFSNQSTIQKKLKIDE